MLINLLIFWVIVITALTGSVISSSRAEGQTGCSVKDQQVIMSIQQTVTAAILSDNLEKIAALNKLLVNSLTSDCLLALGGEQQYRESSSYPSYINPMLRRHTVGRMSQNNIACP